MKQYKFQILEFSRLCFDNGSYKLVEKIISLPISD